MDALTYKYTLPSKRQGLLLQLTDENGRIGWGEISPLPGWSQETLEEAERELEDVKELIVRREKLPDSLLPSVRFGIESALASPMQLRVPVAALLSGTANEIVKQAARCLEEGFTTAKIKISTLELSDAKALLDELKEHIRLRVDLNRAWPLKKALNFFDSFSESDFDFIEEPLQNPFDLQHFPLPVAVDETLRELPLDLILKIPKLKAFVYKPTLEGGARKAIALAKHKIDLVLSSSHENGIGIAQIALLSSLLPKPLPPLGLGTYRPEEDELLEEPLCVDKGHLLVDSNKLAPKKEHLLHG